MKDPFRKPPVNAGSGVVCVDFDGTLFPYRPLYELNPPINGAVEAVRWMKSQGYKIVIFTSRCSTTWCEQSGESLAANLVWVIDRLIENGIPYDDITAEKVPAEFYIDDRAIEFRGDWNEVLERMKSERRVH